MSVVRLSILACFLMTNGYAATAKSPVANAIIATPLNSPGDWVGMDDYPVAALRFDLEGITAFRLIVDATGKPSRCDIVESSGFDVLDGATCGRLMTNARFSPPLDQTGKAVEGIFASRVRWTLPQSASPTLRETFGSMRLSINQTGNVTSCRFVLHDTNTLADLSEEPCKPGMAPPPALGLELRGNYQGPSADVEVQQVDTFSLKLRDHVLATKPGDEQKALNIYKLVVTKEGKVSRCTYVEQRGNNHLMDDYCRVARDKTYAPPLSAFDENGTSTGWRISRVILKTSQ